MAALASEKQQQYDVFLVHSSEDSAKAMQINEALKAKGLNTWAHYKEGNEFFAGKPIFDNIIYAVERSKIVLILVTKNALHSSWVTFEMILSFEKSNREQSMCARLVFEGVTEEEKKKFLTGDLQLIPSVTIDFNKDKWAEELVAKVNEKVSMEDLLPAGNVAVGLVYNYFVGYLRVILPELAGASKQSEYYSEERMFKKLLVLVPDSCKIPKIDGQHGDYVIKRMEKSLEIWAIHGDKKRSYNPAVYSISYKGSEPYYFVGECPFILETMHKINAGKFAEIDLRFQVSRFSLTMMELVNHRNNVGCHNTIHLIKYNDAETQPAAEIWKALEQELKPPSPEMDAPQKTVINKAGKLVETQAGEASTNYFATVSNIDSGPDKRAASSIIQYLENKKVSFNGDVGSELKPLEESNFNIFVLSEEALKDEKFRRQYDSALRRSVDDNKVKVLGVLVSETDIRTLPQNYKWITILKEAEPEYLGKLWTAMKADNTDRLVPITDKEMAECVPVGQVYEGLSYAYLLNYLALAVTGTTADGKGFKQRFEDAMKKYDCKCPCVTRVLVIIPRSCTFPDPGTQFPGEEHLGEIEPVVMGFRKYFLQMYRLTLSNGQKVCYAREYATPAITLHEMANTIPFSGLSKEAMNVQAEEFSKLVTKVIRDEKFKQEVQNLEDKCVMVYFDDEKEKKEGVTKALEEKLEEFLRNKDYIDFQ